ISFHEALQYFQTADLSECREKIQATARRPGLAALLRVLFGPPHLRAQLRGERELALAMAQCECALDDNESVHMRILQTIYKKLTCSRLGCPRYGAHWEELGFQGADPGTDLRGTGMLGLMQILHFVTDARTLPLAREIFKLSQHETQARPSPPSASPLLWNLLIYSSCSGKGKRKNLLFRGRRAASPAASGHRSILTFSRFSSAELELFTKKNPKQLLRSLEAFMNRNTTAGGLRRPSPPSSSSRGGEEIDFTGVCDPRVELEGDARLV
ncbi:ELMD3 protein, partial [Pterocles burchelli]|nr:ELMD3 protein [Pterocles burchelli]